MKKAIRDFTLDEAKSPWIMPGKIAIGHVHIVLGEPGAGVSPALVSLAAHVSDGTDWPGTMGECLTADVVYIDAVRAETPQLAAWFKASRADCDRVHELNFDYRAEVKGAISKLVEDMGQICDARLLVVDDLEGWREQNQLERGRGSFILGEVFHELLRLAQTKGLAIIVAAKLSLNDATAQREIEAYMRFTSISTVFRVMRGEDDVRELVVLRNRIGPDSDAVAFSVKNRRLRSGETAPKTVWKKNYRLRPGESSSSRKRRVVQLIASKLYDKMPSTELYSLRDEAGYSGIGLYRIARDLGWTRKKKGKIWVLREPGSKLTDNSDVKS